MAKSGPKRDPRGEQEFLSRGQDFDIFDFELGVDQKPEDVPQMTDEQEDTPVETDQEPLMSTYPLEITLSHKQSPSIPIPNRLSAVQTALEKEIRRIDELLINPKLDNEKRSLLIAQKLDKIATRLSSDKDEYELFSRPPPRKLFGVY